jgi:hypothetical protein
MAELALNDDQRDALAWHLDGVGLTELVRSEAPPDTSTHRCVAQLLSGGGLRPGAAAGRSGQDAEQRVDGQLDRDVQPLLELFPGPVVMPTSRRRPSLPRRTRSAPRRASRSASLSASASWMRNAARQSTTISPRIRKPWDVVPAWRMTATICSTVGGSAGGRPSAPAGVIQIAR